MTRNRIGRLLAVGMTAMALLLASPLTACADGQGTSQGSDIPAPSASQRPTPEEELPEAVDDEVAKRREALVEEAHAALDETNAALEALDAGERDEALEALARATGKLELVLARDPDLALAPVDVSVVTRDLYATPGAIRAARERAEELLEDGDVQEARALLSGLASEIVIRVTNLPLATYPDAIKSVSPLIDEGRTREAKEVLRSALNSLVLTDHVISLPVLRASAMLEEAEELVNRESASEDERARVDELVSGAREQLEMAELLGYGQEEEHERFRAQIAELERKIRGEQETQGVFARLQRSLEEFQTSFFE